MAIRPILAIALSSSMVVALATDVAPPANESARSGCPSLTARITLNDYDGVHVMQLCVTSQGFSITAGTVNLHVYDNLSDGIFHNGFEAAP